MKRFVYLSLVGLVAAAACSSSSPVNAKGNYTVATTNRDNGSNFQNWTVGAQSTGIAVVITQQNASATAVVNAGAGFVLDVVLGGHSFTGTVDGDHLDLKLAGTRAQTQGNCTYTINGEIASTLAGDTLTGRINYVAAGNGNSDCASIQGCVSFQEFNGTRPPQ